jgi:malonate decarboxylase delta subunit
VDHLHFRLSGGSRQLTASPCVVGVVASGNLEVLIESAMLDGCCTIDVDTAAQGFGTIWQAVIDDFHARHSLADARIAINDNGATPATVSLRLDQAVDEFAASGRTGSS